MSSDPPSAGVISVINPLQYERASASGIPYAWKTRRRVETGYRRLLACSLYTPAL